MSAKFKKTRRILMWVAIIITAMFVIIVMNYRDGYNINVSKAETLTVTSPAFSDNGKMPDKYTRRGEDISPELHLSELSPNAKSIAIIMEDIDFPPALGNFSHWVIWNIPVQEIIPENIPKGESVDSLSGAMQGNAFGKHCYGGPKPPLGASHRYRFNVYVLDTMLEMPADSDKKDLLKNIDGHVLQYGYIIGMYE